MAKNDQTPAPKEETVPPPAVRAHLQLAHASNPEASDFDYLVVGMPEALLAEARVVRMGNRVAVVDARCWQKSNPDVTCATAKAVYNIRRKDD